MRRVEWTSESPCPELIGMKTYSTSHWSFLMASMIHCGWSTNDDVGSGQKTTYTWTFLLVIVQKIESDRIDCQLRMQVDIAGKNKHIGPPFRANNDVRSRNLPCETCLNCPLLLPHRLDRYAPVSTLDVVGLNLRWELAIASKARCSVCHN